MESRSLSPAAEGVDAIMQLAVEVYRQYSGETARRAGWPKPPVLSDIPEKNHDEVKRRFKAQVLSFGQPLMGYDPAAMRAALLAHRQNPDRGRYAPSLTELLDVLRRRDSSRSSIDGKVASGALLGAAIEHYLKHDRNGEGAFAVEFIEHPDGSVEREVTRRMGENGRPVRTWQEVAGPIVAGFVQARGGIRSVADEWASGRVGTLVAQLRDYYNEVQEKNQSDDDWDHAVRMQQDLPVLAESIGVARILKPPNPDSLEAGEVKAIGVRRKELGDGS